MSNYPDMTFVMNLEVEDFINIVSKSLKKDVEAAESKRDELLLHRWGYELPFMQKVITFNEYRNLAIGNVNVSEGSKTSKKYTNDELINKMNKIKEKDQGRATGGES